MRQKGFSLFELVTVIVIIAILLAILLPNVRGIKEQAQIASLKGVAGGFASALGMVKGQWVLKQRPDGIAENKNVTFIDYDGVQVGVDGRFGTATSDHSEHENTRIEAMTAEKCSQVFNAILQDSPSNTLSEEYGDIYNERFLVRYNAKDLQCIYYLTESLDKDDIPKNGPKWPETKGFFYFVLNGKVEVF